MDQQNETTENVLEQQSERETGSVGSDNAGAYYGDYSQEIYQYLLQQDYGSHFEDLKKDTNKISNTLSSVLAVLIFFVFLFFAFKFIRQKGLDL